jgi:hypothetical protein
LGFFVPVYFLGMDSSDLTIEQAAKLNAQFGRMLIYLNNLEKRMSALDFPVGDALRQDLAKARDAMQALFIRSHYLSCDGSVGNPRRSK